MSRGRTLLVLLVLILTVAGAAAIDAASPADEVRAAPVRAGTQSGILSCPLVAAPGVRGYVHVANLSPKGRSPADVRVTVVSGRAPQVTAMRLAPGSLRTIRAQATGRAAATIEYAGGSIVASHSIWLRTHRASGAACSHPAIGDVVVPHLRTLNASSLLSVFNPGSADADVTVSLLADGRELTPERLSRRVVRARSRRDFSLGDFAFDARELTAVVHTDTGAVVAEGLVTDAAGSHAIEGRMPARSGVVIAGVTGAGTVGIANPGVDPIELAARLGSVSGQGTAPGVPLAVAEREAVRANTPSRDHGGPGAYALSTGGEPGLVAATSWLRGRAMRDSGAVAGSAPARRFGAVAAAMNPRGSIRLVVSNPGDELATVRIRVMFPGKERDVDRVLEPGRVSVLALGAGQVAVEVSATVPVAGMLEVVARPAAAARPQGVGVVAVTCQPMEDPPPVAVSIDPRAGVPAAR